jgi:RNA polymerase sigma-70 factor (ECF subfamily)
LAGISHRFLLEQALEKSAFKNVGGFFRKSMARKKSDLQLIREFSRGNQASFEELIKRYSAKVYSLASRFTRNQEDTEEVVQDVFVTVHRKVKNFEGKSAFSSWLYRITVNAALMKLRKKRQDQATPIEDALPQIQNMMAAQATRPPEGEHAALRAQLVVVLDEAIRSLPDEYRPVFILRDVDGLTSKEVSKILELTVPSVKSRLHRSRLILRERLARFYKEYLGYAIDREATSGNAANS